MTIDYKNTLNLPQTDFPMKANLTEREPQILARWKNIDLYHQIQKLNKNRPKFILHEGPPYANGDIHIGHVIDKIIKDMITKSKVLSGYCAPFVPGWDCHGLPIELNVEKELGKAKAASSPKEFRAACRKHAQKYIDRQRESFKRLGVLADWENPYLTMDYSYEANIVRGLATIMAHGHLQRGFKPVHWCIDCGSALAEAEVEYQNRHSPSIDIRFRVVDTNDLIRRMRRDKDNPRVVPTNNPISVAVWTTTPWTLPANQAVAVNPQFDYVIVQNNNEYLLIAEALLKDTMLRYDIDDYRVVASCKGSDLEYLLLQHPFYDQQVPIILGNHVTKETGTGAVHTAPMHGQDDYVLGKQYNLPPIENPVGANGRFNASVPMLAGKTIYEANDQIIELLKTNGNLIHYAKIEHSYPHCWRHKTPLIFRSTPQWFISMEQNGLRETIMAEIGTVKWLPEWGEQRMLNMMATRPDWCISRQRVWGTPMCLIVDQDSGDLHPNMVALLEKIAHQIEQHGIDAWDDLDLHELLGKDADRYVKVKDILDVWFESGISHYCVLAKNSQLQFPADLYSEGSDQYRGWFNSSLTTSCAMNGMAPYRQILTHGFTVDADGHKMSKSLGNVIAPEKLLKTYGADIIRLWTSSVDYQRDIVVSDDAFKHIVDAYRRIRNTARFMLSNLNDFDLTKAVAKEKLLPLDRWAIGKAFALQEEIKTAYDNYQFNLVFQKVHNFCSVDMGSFYLDIIKDRQYTTKANGVLRRSGQTAMYHITAALTRWIAPILSFTAEEIWQYVPDKHNESIFLNTWYEGLFPLRCKEQACLFPTADDDAFWEKVIAIRNAVNKEIERLRANNVLGSSLEAEVTIYANDENYALLNLLGNELRFILITSSATLSSMKNQPNDAVTTEIDGIKLMIKPSSAPKCARCWHRRADVGSNPDHPEICSRCVDNL